MSYPDPIFPLIAALSNLLENKKSSEIFDILARTFCRDCHFPINIQDELAKFAANGGSDNPFPLSNYLDAQKNDTAYKIILAPSAAGAPKSTKIRGIGTYRADQIGSTITITAMGTLPRPGMGVRLEQLPILILPPEFCLFFYEPRLENTQAQNFPATITLHSPTRREKIVVHDADGMHLVDVENF